MISAWWIAPAIFVGAFVGYVVACFMYVGKMSDNNEKSNKK